MPLLFVNLILWHVVSRLLVIYLFASHDHPMIPTSEEAEVGLLLVFNGIAFLILLTLVCSPFAFKKDMPILQRFAGLTGLIFALLSCIHDTLAGSELMHGNDYVFSRLLYPASESYPILYQAIPSILFLTSIVLVVGGAFLLIFRKKWRKNGCDQNYDSGESKALFWFSDLL